VLVGGGGYVGAVVYNFNESMDRQYKLAPSELAASTDPAIV
jgi:hypothetical protein